jgi:hypothetical protein
LKKPSLYIFIFLTFYSVLPAAEIFSNARQYGMAGAYAAAARGSEAIFLNPANLGLRPTNTFSMNILGLSADFSNNALSHIIYQRYVGSYLNSDEIEEILNAIPREGFDLNSNAKIQGISVSYGPFAFGVRGFSCYSSSFAREIFELLLHGNELNRVYEFDPIAGDGITAAAIGLGFGKGFDFEQKVVRTLAFGVTARYLYGFSYAHITDSKFYTSTTYSAIEGFGRIGMNYAEGGRGYGLTAAMSVLLENNWTASIVVQNFASSLTWDRNAGEIDFNFHINENNIERLLEHGAVLDSVIITNESTYAVNSFKTQLPSILNIGLMMPLDSTFLVATEFEQGFENTALSSCNPRFIVGAELMLNNHLRVRSGLSIGGNDETYFSGGFGLNIERFCWDVAMRTYDGITSGTSKGFGLATSLAIRR